MNPAAAEAYLSRPLENHDWLKEVPHGELLSHIYSLGHRFASTPWHNQLVCFELGVAMNEFLFFLKMGGGKSKIILDLIRYRKRRGELVRALVVVPELIHVTSWEEQIREHAPDLSYRLLLGDRDERMEMIEKKSDLCIINHRGLEVYMARRAKVKGKKAEEQVLDPDAASIFAARFNFLAIDEIHRMVSRHSLLFDMCRWLSLGADFRYGLSGSSFGRDPHPLWVQFYLIDQGKTFGTTQGPFRNAFYEAKKSYWAGVEYKFKPETIPDLHRIIKHRSISYELKELRDMPMKVAMRLPVRLTGEGQAYYKRILQGLKEARGDFRSLDSVFIRMRQCASGFISMKADDSSRVQVQFKDNPKLEALRQFVLSKDDKILIFHDFIISGEMIERMLEKAKVGYASLRGGTKDPAAQYAKFLTDPTCQCFVLNNQLGSEAINPQYVCRRAVFYESPIDPKRREQAEGRVHRPGQEWTTFIYDLTVLGSVEEKILGYVRAGRDLLRAVMTGDESLVPDDETGESR